MRRILRDYFTLGTLGTVASVVGIAAGARNLFGNRGGGSTGQGGTSAYIPQAQPAIDQNFQDIMRRMMEATGATADQLMPILQQAFGNMTGGPMGDRLGQYGDWSRDVGMNLLGSTEDLYGVGRDIWKQAADPMNKLHDKLQQQTTEGSRAATSARGIGMSPQAAGLENDAVGNFNMNWQQGLLDRMLRGGQGVAGAYNQAGQNSLGGISALGSGANFMQSQYGLPFQAAGLYGDAMQRGVYNPWNQMMGNSLNYMGMGSNAAQQNFQQQQTGLNNFTTGLDQFSRSPGWGTIQRYFGNTGPGQIDWNLDSGMG